MGQRRGHTVRARQWLKAHCQAEMQAVQYVLATNLEPYDFTPTSG